MTTGGQGDEGGADRAGGDAAERVAGEPTERPAGCAGERDAEILRRLDGLQSLFERRLLVDRDKRRLIEDLRDGPYRQYLHPLVHRLTLLIDRLDHICEDGAAHGADGAARPGSPGGDGPQDATDVPAEGGRPPQGPSPEAGVVGVAAAIREELLDALAAQGVTEIAVRDGFDPSCHEAVEAVPDDGRTAGTVHRVHRRGFRHGAWVFRPARVAVVTHGRG